MRQKKWYIAVFLASGLYLVFGGMLCRAENDQQCKQLYLKARALADYNTKLSLYQECTRLCPHFAEAWNNLADTEENLGYLDEAIAHYKNALEINPNLAEAHFGLGDIYFKKEYFQNACKEYNAGLRIAPGDELALKNLREAETAIQAKGETLPSDYIKKRLGGIRLMGIGVKPTSLAFQNILFKFDSDRIQPQSYPQLDEIGKALAEIKKESSLPRQFLIEGHTDKTGDYEYNMKLSHRRAQAVSNYLVERFGIERDMLITQGCGYEKPLAGNDTEEGRERNRRVEIKVR